MSGDRAAETNGDKMKRFLWIMAFMLGLLVLIAKCELPPEKGAAAPPDAQPIGDAPKAAPKRRAETVGVRFEGTLVESREQGLSREDWGDEWPLAVDEATVSCVPQFSEVNGGTFLIADGLAFALTGSTQTMVRARRSEVMVVSGDLGWQTPPLFTGDDPASDRLWVRQPSQDDGLPWRINISPVLDAAIALCKE